MWWNNQEDNPIVGKIDKILTNDDCLQMLPFSYGTFEEAEFSNHTCSCVCYGHASVG